MDQVSPLSTLRLGAAALALLLGLAAHAADAPLPPDIAGFFEPPAEYVGKMGDFRSPLRFEDGSPVKTPEDWARRREEIKGSWHALMGEWPALLESPKFERGEPAPKEGFTQYPIRVEIAEGRMTEGYLLIPPGSGKFPAVLVPFYDPESSLGLKKPNRDFARQLALRGFVTLAIGSPGGDAYKPDSGNQKWQPLSFLAYIAANCANALANLPEVDAKRLGIVGHSYGGKWAMFGSCLSDRFACAAWSDPGIIFNEARPSVNYWEPWYLGQAAGTPRKSGLISKDSPRTGAYKLMREKGMDLHELHALMAPRPFLVSGGSEDPVSQWIPLNHTMEVNRLLGFRHRIAMSNRPDHSPTLESNELICRFFEHFLQPR